MGGRSQEGYSGQRKNEQAEFGDPKLLGSNWLKCRIQTVGQRRSWEGRNETGGGGRARSWRASHATLKTKTPSWKLGWGWESSMERCKQPCANQIWHLENWLWWDPDGGLEGVSRGAGEHFRTFLEESRLKVLRAYAKSSLFWIVSKNSFSFSLFKHFITCSPLPDYIIFPQQTALADE